MTFIHLTLTNYSLSPEFLNYYPLNFLKYHPLNFFTHYPLSFLKYYPLTFLKCYPLNFLTHHPLSFLKHYPLNFLTHYLLNFLTHYSLTPLTIIPWTSLLIIPWILKLLSPDHPELLSPDLLLLSWPSPWTPTTFLNYLLLKFFDYAYPLNFKDYDPRHYLLCCDCLLHLYRLLADVGEGHLHRELDAVEQLDDQAGHDLEARLTLP